MYQTSKLLTREVFWGISTRGFCRVAASLALIFFSPDTFSQTNLSLPDLLRMRSDANRETSPLYQPSIALDSPVDPSEYFVGPGDFLGLNIWSSAPLDFRLSVTPEGSLLIPNVGAVSVKAQTLSAIKTSVAKIVSIRYPGAEVTLTLLSPRKIIVQIAGDVLNEMNFEMNSLQRVDRLIAQANELPAGVADGRSMFTDMLRARRSSSLRNIMIQRSDGTRIRSDLVKYRITGEDKYNPYLREGDYVFVPSKEDMGLSIAILGGVRLPGSFEFVPGDSLTDLIAMGYGFKATADSHSATFSRLTPDGRVMETLEVDPTAILERRVPNISLMPGDRLLVKEIPELRSSRIVAVDGAVKQPGRYPITINSTRLSEVIAAAGGLTDDANLKAATLTRARISPQSAPEEIALEQLLSARSNLGVQDTNYYLTETALRLKGELVSVDFFKVLAMGDSTQDVTLRNFDKINIPRFSRTVYVFGQVLSPGHVDYTVGKDYHYYIEKAAGFSADARTGDVKIIKGSTRIWLEPSETTIEDGDYIWVPKERSYPFAYHISIWSQVAGIVGAVATVALLINSISK